jgi:hypothetical protein
MTWQASTERAKAAAERQQSDQRARVQSAAAKRWHAAANEGWQVAQRQLHHRHASELLEATLNSSQLNSFTEALQAREEVL